MRLAPRLQNLTRTFMNSPEDIEKLVQVLKDLVEVNRHRLQTYLTAGKKNNVHVDLATLFYEKLKQSEEFIQELELEISQMEGTVKTPGTREPGAIERLWKGIKQAFAGEPDESVFGKFESVEEIVAKTYDEALRSDTKMPAHIRQKIVEQQTAIRKTQDLLRKYSNLNLRPINYNNSFTS